MDLARTITIYSIVIMVGSLIISTLILYLIIPLFISCFDKADELTNAMVARGYDSDMPRSRYNHLSTSRIDFFASGVVVVCLVIIAILNGVLL